LAPVHEVANDGFFAIPDLPFSLPEDVPKPSKPADPTDSAQDIPDTQEEAAATDPDIWAVGLEPIVSSAKYQSWDVFEEVDFVEPPTAYITEAGPDIFDCALADKEDILGLGNSKYELVDTEAFMASLKALGQGRDSILYRWDAEKESFTASLEDVRISGCTGDSVEGLQASFMQYGNTTKHLRGFVSQTYSNHKSSGRIALADAISALLNSLQGHLDDKGRWVTSVLQLEALFKPAATVLALLKAIIAAVGPATSDEELLTRLFDYIQFNENQAGWLREVFLEVLSRVSAPWLEFAGEWLGLQREAGLPMSKEGPSRSFVRVEQRHWIDEQGMELQEPDYIFDEANVPSFIAAEESKVMFETGKSLRFLRVHHEQHPLARADVVASAEPPRLEWKYSWTDVESVQAKARQYEQDLMTAIEKYSKTSVVKPTTTDQSTDVAVKLDFFGKPEEDMKAHMLASIESLNGLLPSTFGSGKDRLSLLMSEALLNPNAHVHDEETTFRPPISLTPSLSFAPILATQARIINGASMRLFFSSHQLREHLFVQRRFHLLGDGVFSSRLQHALFDPELETAERQRGVARTGNVMGLRLGGRDTWPPASSELRLALMGVLTESYNPSEANSGGYLDRKRELPGDLSFGVRDMSEEEINKCMNPDSISALDFLRLSYKPPPPLEAIITPLCLYKYDQLFKLLLRVMRMLFVVNQLFRDATDRTSYWQGLDNAAQKFRIESRHFVASISGYFFDTGVGATWSVFENKLDEVQGLLEDNSGTKVLGQYEGLDKLRQYHESILDRIMFALFLRKRQQPVINLLEEIFEMILAFAKHSRERASGKRRVVGRDEEVRNMYLAFRKKVGVFITVCRGLSERREWSDRRSMNEDGGLFSLGPEENTVGQLLARLEMSGYYSQRVNM
jgi:hypothetical protein